MPARLNFIKFIRDRGVISEQMALDPWFRTGINYDFLTSAINQIGPWQGQSITVDKAWLLSELERKITSIKWKQAAENVRRFVRMEEQPSLDLWSKELFLGQLDKLKQVDQ